MDKDLPLGRDVDYPTTYTPDELRAIPRSASRSELKLSTPLPFDGEDWWTAWELTWMQPCGRPAIAAAEIIVPANSPNIVESKSLKLYLNSFAMSEFATRDEVRTRVEADLASVVEAPVSVTFLDTADAGITDPPGACIDNEISEFSDLQTATAGLCTDSESPVTEELYSQLFRSLCPVTAQPDFATVQISYRGPRIHHGSLLAYVVAFREHQDFHEACVERMFCDLKAACEPESLCVSARFLRRGGIDINPWRATGDRRCSNTRLWRQ